ncbi:MAG TPA: hypothetical protein VK644_04230 [Chitinophagaceae bacterium]|nr:hypothetical protein [Chitinophagaceae bacterium]
MDNDWLLYQPIKTGTLLRRLARQQAAYEKECVCLSQIIFVSRLRPDIQSALIDFFDSPGDYQHAIDQSEIILN